MLLSGGLIGLILGCVPSQQGMFILGGTLADRYGAKAIILAGCVVRVAGFLLLACGASLWPIILGACLTGVGGALFSVDRGPAGAGRHPQPANGKRSRAEWFALFAVCGELGAVIGPVAGGVLSGSAFGISPSPAREYFFWRWRCSFLSARRRAHDNNAQTSPMVDAFAPAALCRVYSRLQLMAVELQPTVPRPAGGDPTFRRQRAGSGAALYAGLAVDYHPPAPLARFARRMGAVRILPVGFLLLSASFASVALFAAAPPAEGWLRLMPAAGFVTLLTLGQMLLVPAARI